MVMHPNPSDFQAPRPPNRLWLYVVIAAVFFGAGMSIERSAADGPVPAQSEGSAHSCRVALEAAIEGLDLAFQYLNTDPSMQARLGSIDAQMADLADDPRVTQDTPICLASGEEE